LREIVWNLDLRKLSNTCVQSCTGHCGMQCLQSRSLGRYSFVADDVKTTRDLCTHRIRSFSNLQYKHKSITWSHSIISFNLQDMSRSAYTAFQRHLVFFSTPTTPPKLTFISGVRAAISLGLDFPVAVILSLSLRLMYAPFPYLLSTINIEQIPRPLHRTQLSRAKLSQSEYTCSELLALLDSEPRKGFVKHKIDQGHIVGFWSMAANTRTHTVSIEDVERFQQGEWEEAVVKRRRGRDDVLPLWRGGPIIAAAHSWAVQKLLGVRVYEAKR
jgi:hypothetical protein